VLQDVARGAEELDAVCLFCFLGTDPARRPLLLTGGHNEDMVIAEELLREGMSTSALASDPKTISEPHGTRYKSSFVSRLHCNPDVRREKAAEKDFPNPPRMPAT